MKKLFTTVLLCLGLASSLVASATVFMEDGGDTVRFSVNVDADVYYEGKKIGEVSGGSYTRQFVRSQKGSKTVTFKKYGYKDASVTLRRRMAMHTFWNIAGGWFSTTSTAVDAVEGNMKEHTPRQFMIVLRKK